jgi:hypothetical protein
MTATRTGTNGQPYSEILPLLLVTITRNIKSQNLFKLNSLKHNTMAYLLQARTVEPQKESFLSNALKQQWKKEFI